MDPIIPYMFPFEREYLLGNLPADSAGRGRCFQCAHEGIGRSDAG